AVLAAVVLAHRREMEGHVRRVAPVQQARRQAVVLGEGKPVPHGIVTHEAAAGVLPEIADQMPLLGRGVAPEPHQPGPQVQAPTTHAPEPAERAEPAQLRIPRALEQELVQLAPTVRDDGAVGGGASIVPCMAHDPRFAGSKLYVQRRPLAPRDATGARGRRSWTRPMPRSGRTRVSRAGSSRPMAYRRGGIKP